MRVQVSGVLCEFVDVEPFVDGAELVLDLLGKVVDVWEACPLPSVQNITVTNELPHFQRLFLRLSEIEG